MNLSIVYEDNHLLVVNKPAGLATQGAAPGEPSLVDRAKADLKRRFAKPGNVYLGVVSRLDASVTGLVVLARTSKAAARLTEQFRTREVEKIYWAAVSGNPPPTATLVDWLWHDDAAHRVRVAKPEQPGAQEAQASLRRLASIPRGAVVRVVLETGRKHQIRVQLAARGWPVWGDRKYGSVESLAGGVAAGIALHARRLTITHPTRQERMTFEAPLPESWRAWRLDERALSGDEATC